MRRCCEVVERVLGCVERICTIVHERAYDKVDTRGCIKAARTGLKKCSPTNLSGRPLATAMLVIGWHRSVSQLVKVRGFVVRERERVMKDVLIDCTN